MGPRDEKWCREGPLPRCGDSADDLRLHPDWEEGGDVCLDGQPVGVADVQRGHEVVVRGQRLVREVKAKRIIPTPPAPSTAWLFAARPVAPLQRTIWSPRGRVEPHSGSHDSFRRSAASTSSTGPTPVVTEAPKNPSHSNTTVPWKARSWWLVPQR